MGKAKSQEVRYSKQIPLWSPLVKGDKREKKPAPRFPPLTRGDVRLAALALRRNGQDKGDQT